jgi:ABC-type branched-subunit amino acid transport system substrate-binding protein
MVAGPVLQYAQSKGLKRVGAIVADYAWGQAFKAAIEEAFKAAPDIQLQVKVAPVGETDFTTYLRGFESFKPDLIVATGHPPGSGPITVQSADLGFDVPVTGAYTPRSLVMSGAKDAAIDRYADFSCADFTSPAYQDLARKFLAANSDAKFFEDDALAGYGIVKMLADTIGKVGDNPEAIAKHLHESTFTIPGYAFEMRWTEWGELANAKIAFDLIGKGPAPDGVNNAGTWYPQRLLVSEPLQPFQPQ